MKCYDQLIKQIAECLFVWLAFVAGFKEINASLKKDFKKGEN